MPDVQCQARTILLGSVVRCPERATRKRLDWWVCVEHVTRGQLASEMIGKDDE